MPSRLERLVQASPKSLIAEFLRIFGEQATEKLLTVFAGTTIQVPSTKNVEDALRDIAIYETLSQARNPAQSRRFGVSLAAQYRLTRVRVRKIYHKMYRQNRLNQKLLEADRATGKHQISRIKVQRKTRLKL